MKTSRISHKSAGLTLIELLVTVVILSFTVALMSGAFNQISQILRVSSEQSNGFPARWIQSRALYDLVGNMVIDPTREKAFSGNHQSIEMVSLAVPEEQPGVAHAVKLSLQDSKNFGSASDLMLAPSDSFGREQTEPLKLASFQGRMEFVFVDHLSAEHAQWPPNGMTANRPMPSAILLRANDGKRTVMRMAAYEGNLSPPNRAVSKMFGLDAP